MLTLAVIAVLLASSNVGAVEDAPNCMVLFLQPQPALMPLDVSTTVGNFGECEWRKPGLPLGYRLERSAYTVQFRVFQNNSGGIALKAVDVSGNPLRLRGAMFMDAVEMEIPLTFKGVDYRYWVLSNWLKSQPIEFEVIGSNDLVLGHERLPYREVHPRRAKR